MLTIRSGLTLAASRYLSVLAKPTMKKSYILYSLDESKVIKQKNPNLWFKAASLVKLVYAIDLMRRIERQEPKNKKINIGNFVANEGTNILRDITLDETTQLCLSLKTLIRLMLKHSCNGSTYAIWDHSVIPVKKFQDRLKNIWKLNTKIFDKAGTFKNIMRPIDFLTIYRHIYDNSLKNINKNSKEFLQNCLEEGKSRYSIFDQKSHNIKILGCKGGQIFEIIPPKAYFHGSGAFLVKSTGKKYIIVTMTESLDLASARDWTRKIGKELLTIAEKIK